ncbi:MAG: methyltransferase domain-containing protein, partial [Planctomycetes bacterium]|nr:methyltransferase domain-containing protein [Planctomycetota bacterium]
MSEIDYSALYEEYWYREDRWGSSSFTDAEELALRVLKVGGGGSVLDVGCGMGALVHALLAGGVDARGVDVATRCVEEGNRRAPGRFSVGSILELPFEDSSADTVVCTDMLEHLAEDDVDRAIAELVRVARRHLFVCVGTREDRDKRWHLTIQPRAWWEQRFLGHGLRKHPRGQAVLPYTAIDREDREGRATLVFERLPAEALRAYPLSILKDERDLHTDMFREAGRRSDAHIARYMLAAQFARPNDRVLDVSCGLGYGSAVLWYNAEPERVTGLDVSDFAVEYATANYAHTGAGAAQHAAVEFRVGDAQDLSFLADESVDLVVSFETLEHLRDPSAFLAQAHRVLTPGGRLIASVPNHWTDESGADPNKDHLHVYDWASLSGQIGERFLIEAAFAQIAGGGMKLTDRSRSMVRLDVTPDGSGPDGEAEWWLIVAMKDPVNAAGSIDADRHFPVPAQSDEFNVTAFARDYDNPWLVRAMVSIGLRADSAPLLELIASRALDSARPGSSDEGAALFVLGYQRLGAGPDAGAAAELVEQLLAYQRRADKTPHGW